MKIFELPNITLNIPKFPKYVFIYKPKCEEKSITFNVDGTSPIVDEIILQPSDKPDSLNIASGR